MPNFILRIRTNTTISQRLYRWWTVKPAKAVLLETLSEAKLFEEWEAAAYQLDELLSNDLWYGACPCNTEPTAVLIPSIATQAPKSSVKRLRSPPDRLPP